VLIVGDSDDDALPLLRELRRGGYEPEHARVDTLAAVREALADSDWDVILSEHRPPRFEGWEALQMVREAGSEAPFIVVSDRKGEEVAVETMKAGAYDYVMKGELARLCGTIEHGLEEARHRRERRRTEEELRRRDAILEAVRFAADRLLGETIGWEENIRVVLRRLGEATGTSRVYVTENYTGVEGELCSRERHKWVAPGATPETADPLGGSMPIDFPYRDAGLGRWTEVLGRGEPIYGHTREFPSSERPMLVESRGILSIALVPIFVEGRWWGFVGFDECSTEREWSVTEVGAAWGRRRAPWARP
jgi:CheY-like chemotaxis protein